MGSIQAFCGGSSSSSLCADVTSASCESGSGGLGDAESTLNSTSKGQQKKKINVNDPDENGNVSCMLFIDSSPGTYDMATISYNLSNYLFYEWKDRIYDKNGKKETGSRRQLQEVSSEAAASVVVASLAPAPAGGNVAEQASEKEEEENIDWTAVKKAFQMWRSVVKCDVRTSLRVPPNPTPPHRTHCFCIILDSF